MGWLLGFNAIRALPSVSKDLSIDTTGDPIIELLSERGARVAASNPLRFVEDAELLPYWGDLHGQSEETIGTNSARDFHLFARTLDDNALDRSPWY